jgi:MoxR-like ATPase
MEDDMTREPTPTAGNPSTTPTARLAEVAAALRATLERHVLGQRAAIEALLAAYLAGGHALIEGVPGIAKTLLARCFAAGLGAQLARVQFTPDLMASDLLGTNVFDPRAGAFHLLRGPVFSQVLMADEVNRTPPKTQSALLEAMQERQVTIDGVSYPLPAGFFVIATQNPIEFEGVYPLPEAQLDRFLVKIEMGLPAPEAERELLRRAAAGGLVGWDAEAALPDPVAGPEETAALRGAAGRVHVAVELLDYLAQLAHRVRSSPHVELGPSPRGVLALLATARAAALLEEREFVAPDDLKHLMVPCWGHRLMLTAESELEGYRARRILEEVAAAVEVPR